MTFYIHNPYSEDYEGTAEWFELGQDIYLIPHTDGEEKFIASQFNELDTELSLDFVPDLAI